MNKNMLPLNWKQWELIRQYDLGPILEDCTFTSYKDHFEAVENWWAENWKFILQACLEKTQSFRQTASEEK